MAKGQSPTLRLDEAGALRLREEAETEPQLTWQAIVVTVIWFLLVVLLLTPYSYFKSYTTLVGAPARADVIAPYDFEVVDVKATDEGKRHLEETKQHIWVRNTQVEDRAQTRMKAFMDLLKRSGPQNAAELNQFTQTMREQFDIALDVSTVAAFLPGNLRSLHPPLTSSDIERDVTLAITNILNFNNIVSEKVSFQAHHGSDTLELINERGISDTVPAFTNLLEWNRDEIRPYLVTRALIKYYPGESYLGLRQAIADMLLELLAPNITFDPKETNMRQEARINALKADPIDKKYRSGDLITQKGDQLTRLQADALDRLNDLRSRSLAIKMIGIMLIVAAMFLAVGVYLKRFRREEILNPASITLHALPPIVALAIGQIMVTYGQSQEVVMLAFPAATVGMLSSLLITPQVAFVLVLVTILLFGVTAGMDLSFMVLSLFSGFAAVLASRLVRARGEVLLVGLQVGLVNMITLTILKLIVSAGWPTASSLMFGFLNGLACAFGTLILLVIFERLFGIVTDLRLLELTGLKHPLLRRLEREAPGTYQHVLNVTKLAEAAAEAIGANYLLVRAGAYFHDIGKMIKPKYYSENQVNIDDKKAHSKLSPYMSVLIIKNHVKEGIELARKGGLPQKIIDFIPQHHGSGLIRYFYGEALRRYEESETVDPVHEVDFRYPGPKPQSVESAIVLLADSVEAIAASKFTGGQVNANEIRKTVQEAISEKFNDGQFDECDLTMRQLYEIREAFARTLMARYHFRIAYPALPKRDVTAAQTLAGTISVAGPGSTPGG